MTDVVTQEYTGRLPASRLKSSKILNNHLSSSQSLVFFGVVNERKTLKVNVAASTMDLVKEIAARYDMKQEAAAGRVFDWLAAQDEIVQAWVLGVLPDAVKADAAKAMIERMAQESRPLRYAAQQEPKAESDRPTKRR